MPHRQEMGGRLRVAYTPLCRLDEPAQTMRCIMIALLAKLLLLAVQPDCKPDSACPVSEWGWQTLRG